MEHTWSNSLRMLFCLIVLETCQDRRHCRLLASTSVFGQDPCPSTSKYLEVKYKCRPNEFLSRVACDGEELQLHCSKSQRVAVYSSSFGWSRHSDSASKCAEYTPYSRECSSPCAYGHVYSRCHGRKRCNVRAYDGTFHSDCEAGTPKYLMVVYTCVPKRILSDIDEDVEYPDPCEAALPTPDTIGPVVDPAIEVAPGNTEDTYTYYGGHDYRYDTYGGDNGGDINGQPGYVPPPSTISYDNALTPHPDEGYGTNGNRGDIKPSLRDDVTQEPDTGASLEGAELGFVDNWISTWNFVTDNIEKLILYITLGLLVGLVCVLLVIIGRLDYLRRRNNREAKLNITEPIANSSLAAAQQQETTSLLDQSDQSDGGVEMTSYNQIGSMRRPPVSSFTDPYEEETPVVFSTTPKEYRGTDGLMTNNNGQQRAPGYTSRPTSNHGNGNGGAGFTTSVSRPNHTRQTSFSGSLGRASQPGMLTGSLNRRDHWTNEYRNDGHSQTLQHYYG